MRDGHVSVILSAFVLELLCQAARRRTLPVTVVFVRSRAVD